jgi:hypothetical protein
LHIESGSCFSNQSDRDKHMFLLAGPEYCRYMVGFKRGHNPTIVDLVYQVQPTAFHTQIDTCSSDAPTRHTCATALFGRFMHLQTSQKPGSYEYPYMIKTTTTALLFIHYSSHRLHVHAVYILNNVLALLLRPPHRETDVEALFVPSLPPFDFLTRLTFPFCLHPCTHSRHRQS